jgi:hypothetical protein
MVHFADFVMCGVSILATAARFYRETPGRREFEQSLGKEYESK